MNKRGSILADEMGLGKTLSAIALIVCFKTTAMMKKKKNEKFEDGPTLIVCPATVINQWKEEIMDWAGDTFKDKLHIYNSQTKKLGVDGLDVRFLSSVQEIE